jgi:signal transduction histidine kinase/ligand-binding sensor domain-containing protein/DNA-binding response OmpR family regulator
MVRFDTNNMKINFHRMFNRLSLVVFIVFLMLNVNGQQIRYYNVADGLSSRHTYGVEQDHKGFLWFATNEGIDRYDGSEFKNYKLNETSILPSNLGYRFNIVTDTSQVIWAYTTSGKIFKYNDFTDAFELRYEIQTNPEQFRTRPYTNKIFIDKTNRIWIGTTIGIFTIIPGKSEQPIFLTNFPKAFAFEESETGQIWAGTNNGVVTIDVDKSGQPVLINSPITLSTKGVKVRSLFHNKTLNQLWIGSDDNGPSVYNFSSNSYINLENLTPKIPIRSFQMDKSNNLLIGLDGAGLIDIDPKTFKVTGRWNMQDKDHNELSDNSVLDIFCDNGGRIWVSTWAEGITMIDLQKPSIEILRDHNENSKSLKNNLVNSIFEDSDGDIWFGTNEGVTVFNQKNKKWNHLPEVQNSSEISGYKILSICEDNQKRIWIGGYANGVHCYDKKTRQFSNYSNQIGSKFIYSIFYDSYNHLWFGGMDGNLTRLDLNTGVFTQLPLSNISSIIKKSSYELWIGCTTGLNIVNIKNDNITPSNATVKNKLANSYINCLLYNSTNKIWIGTNGGGLNLFHTDNDSIEVYSVENGLPSNFIYGITSDSRGRIWLSTDKGIVCFDPDKKIIINTGTIKGLTHGAFNRCAYCRLKNGALVFGGSMGIISFIPEKIESFSGSSKLVLNEFKISYRRVKPSDNDSPLKLPIDDTKSINLRYNQNSFSFNFSTINYENADQIAFQWHLEGFDTDWTPLTTSKNAGYTNIPPGDYNFKLRCINRNNLELIDQRSLHISVAPPFWKSKLAIAIYILFIGTLIYLFYKVQQDRLQKKHSDDKIRFFINTAHDIKTPLSLIQAPLNDLEHDKGITDQGLYYLKLAKSNAERLSAIVNQVLDFDKYDSRKFQLVLTNNNLNTYLIEKINSFKNLADKKEIRLNLQVPEYEINAVFDIDKMDKIIDNLVSNAIKYTPANGTVTLTAGSTEKEWTIEVADNGIGIPKKAQKELFKLYYRADNAINTRIPGSGIGLMLTQHLVNMHGGKISFTSFENEGSAFRLKFPVLEKNVESAVDSGLFSPSTENENVDHLISDEIFSNKKSVLPKTQLRILIAEDDYELRKYLAKSLSSIYITSEAEDGLQALEMVQSHKFDLVLSDVMMPKLRGDDLCRKIKQNFDTSHIPVILLTALSDKVNTISGLEAGADNYVSKPFDIDVILARINNVFRNRELLRENLLKGISPKSEKVFINNLDQAFVQNLMAIVNKELSNPDFSINDLCREVGMSRTLLYEKIKALTNLAPNEFIRINRMNQAIELLKSGRYSINEVGFMVGFQDSKYFSTAFKKFFGKSPKQFLPRKS